MAKGCYNGRQKRIAVGFLPDDWNRLNAFARECQAPLTTVIRELTLAELARHDS